MDYSITLSYTIPCIYYEFVLQKKVSKAASKNTCMMRRFSLLERLRSTLRWTLNCCDVTFMTTPLIYCLFHGEFQRFSRQSTEVQAAWASSCNPCLEQTPDISLSKFLMCRGFISKLWLCDTDRSTILASVQYSCIPSLPPTLNMPGKVE